MEGLLDIVPCPALNLTGSGGWNGTFPCWDPHMLPRRDVFRRVLDQLNIYFTPVLILVGVTGNLTSFLVFTMTHVRRQSASVFLASLALVDLGFLLALFVVWFSWIQIPLFHHQGACQMVVYMTYVCTFLSVWYVVGFTVERYIIVWYPLRRDRLCTRRRARIVVVSLAVIGCLIYSFTTWTSGIVYIHTIPLCMPFPQYYHLLTAVTGIDSTLTLIIPSIVIIILNIRITMTIKKVVKRSQLMTTSHLAMQPLTEAGNLAETAGNCVRARRWESPSSGKASFSSDRRHNRVHTDDPTPSTSSSHEADTFRKCQVRVHVRYHAQYKKARMLIIASSAFVLLNLPGHMFKIHAFIQTSISAEFTANRKFDMRWQELFQLVSHLNFAINFFIYTACAQQFRTGLKVLYTRFRHGLTKWRHELLVRNMDVAQV